MQNVTNRPKHAICRPCQRIFNTNYISNLPPCSPLSVNESSTQAIFNLSPAAPYSSFVRFMVEVNQSVGCHDCNVVVFVGEAFRWCFLWPGVLWEWTLRSKWVCVCFPRGNLLQDKTKCSKIPVHVPIHPEHSEKDLLFQLFWNGFPGLMDQDPTNSFSTLVARGRKNNGNWTWTLVDVKAQATSTEPWSSQIDRTNWMVRDPH